MKQIPEKIWEVGEYLWGQQGLKKSGKLGITLQDGGRRCLYQEE